MERITETHDEVFSVTIVCCGRNKYILMDVRIKSEVNLALMLHRLREYIELTVQLHTAGEV